MRHMLATILALILLGLPVKADEAAARVVIMSQIEAFEADDFTTAFTYASPTIKQIFGNPQRFGEMVRQGFPMVWRPAEVTFLSSEMRDGRRWQDVLFRDAAGAFHVLEYEMIAGPDGWKINGVRRKDPFEGTA